MSFSTHQSQEGAKLRPIGKPFTQSQRMTVNHEKAPHHYSRTVSDYSAKSKEESLYPGVHYRALALFLNGQNSLQTPISTSRRQPFVFAALHNLAFGFDDSRRITGFNSDIARFTDHKPQQDHGGQLLFLRGFPSPGWVNTIGARYRIDPEFFRRHLTLGCSRNFYDLPAPPSASSNIINLNITSIGRRQPSTSTRFHGSEDLHKHFQRLGSDPFTVGDSIVRRFSAHDNEHFSIEQKISISVVKREDGWIAIILLDNGRDLDQGPRGPWFDNKSMVPGFDELFLPIIQLQPKLCFKEFTRQGIPIDQNGSHLALARSRFSQSACLLHTDAYGSFLSPSLMQTDAFYALHGLFHFSIFSESQFINLLKSKFDIETQRFEDEEYMQDSFANLKYNKQVLDDHIQQLQELRTVIEQRGSLKWPRAKASTEIPSMEQILSGTAADSLVSLNQECKRAHSVLLMDCAAVLHRAESLSRAYSTSMDDIRNRTLLLDSRKAIEQAEAVARLTLLAFLFVPVSFTTSFFGMNFKELGDKLSIWVWFAMSLPVFCFAMAFCFWKQTRSLLSRFWKPFHNVFVSHDTL